MVRHDAGENQDDEQNGKVDMNMQKYLLVTGLFIVTFLSSCLGNGGSNGETTTDPSKTKVEIDGRYVEVDTFTANHYYKHQIQKAIDREDVVSKVVRPTDASSFGKKKAKVVNRAFNANVEECGTVTIIFYEKGLEIVKDGQSWFYDGENLIENPLRDSYEYGKRYPDIHYIRDFGAAESVLHPGIWEPILKNYLITNDWECKYAYTGEYTGNDSFYITERQQKQLGLFEYSEWIISKETY